LKEVIFINSHPIQYFAPLYKYMNDNGIKTKAWYCSGNVSKAKMDKEFGVEVKWDIPLLEGYESRFFKNYSFKESLEGFFGLVNLGMIVELFRIPKSIIVVHGWHYFSNLSILLLGKLRGHTVCLRCEMPQNQEEQKKGWKQGLKKTVLKRFLFPRINNFLYIGTQNKLFYKSYGLADERLVFCPYSVDNNRFRLEKKRLQLSVTAIREKMGIALTDKVILYSGKYIDKKRPMDLLMAFERLNQPDAWLIMVGEGELRGELEKEIQAKQIKRVILTGFVNQSMISEFYAISDVFVMCSSIGETWGLSVNEAMNFDLPIIVSDMTGCSSDLVKENENGYTFPTGNVDELFLKLKKVIVNKDLKKSISSQSIVDKYSYASIVDEILPLAVS